jgi:hypothetical protein
VRSDLVKSEPFDLTATFPVLMGAVGWTADEDHNFFESIVHVTGVENLRSFLFCQDSDENVASIFKKREAKARVLHVSELVAQIVIVDAQTPFDVSKLQKVCLHVKVDRQVGEISTHWQSLKAEAGLARLLKLN